MDEKYMLTLCQMIVLSKKVDDKAWKEDPAYKIPVEDRKIGDLIEGHFGADIDQMPITEYYGEIPGTLGKFRVSIYRGNTDEYAVGGMKVTAGDVVSNVVIGQYLGDCTSTESPIQISALTQRHEEISKLFEDDDVAKARKPLYQEALKLLQGE